MSSIIYVVPWAICDTESIYVKKVKGDDIPVPEKGSEFNSWCIRNVMASPDRRTKDTYAIVDVFNGYKDKMNEKGMSVFSLTNSPNGFDPYSVTYSSLLPSSDQRISSSA